MTLEGVSLLTVWEIVSKLDSVPVASLRPGHSQVVDAAVLKFRGAVTHFSPGSYASRPLQRTSFPNLFMAGAPPATTPRCLALCMSAYDSRFGYCFAAASAT
jgi:hypothetical protein